ncbi:MAG: gamma-butyrobetaine hydroxylase-like domain-containing protein [Arenicella sp.]
MTPTNIQLHQKTRILDIDFSSGEVFKLPCEYLRVFSPSAEVQGHGPGQEVLQIGKENVNIIAIEPIGQYAVRLVFDDEHSSGLYTWELLYSLGKNRTDNWKEYLQRLESAGHTRSNQTSDALLEA